MVKNIRYFGDGAGLELNLAVASGIESGDVVVFNDLAGVAITDRDTSGYATVRFPLAFVIDVSVTGEDGSGNSAVAIGEKLYITSGTISKIATGTPVGYALEAVTSGATSTILVGFASMQADASANYLSATDATVVHAKRATLAHTDTTAKDLFSLPAGAQILDWQINVTTAFDDSGSSDIIDIGNADTADAYVADFDCGTAGLTVSPSTVETALAEATTIKGVYTPGTGATAGAATIVVHYIIPGS